VLRASAAAARRRKSAAGGLVQVRGKSNKFFSRPTFSLSVEGVQTSFDLSGARRFAFCKLNKVLWYSDCMVYLAESFWFGSHLPVSQTQSE
jgi:hypothetical protein